MLIGGAPVCQAGRSKTLARVPWALPVLQFTRITQLPAVSPGSEVFHPQDASFVFQPGPLFNHLVLADEINRSPAKVQSALLEAMAEHQITVGKKSWRLPSLFMVAATQNPTSSRKGPILCREAQLDRFLLKLLVDYPSPAMELAILQLNARGDAPANAAGHPQPVRPAGSPHRRSWAQMQGRLEHHLVQLVCATRPGSGLVPRARPLVAVEPVPEPASASQEPHGPGLACRARLRAARRHPATGACRAAPPLIPSYQALADNLDSEALITPAAECHPMPLSRPPQAALSP